MFLKFVLFLTVGATGHFNVNNSILILNFLLYFIIYIIFFKTFLPFLIFYFLFLLNNLNFLFICHLYFIFFFNFCTHFLNVFSAYLFFVTIQNFTLARLIANWIVNNFFEIFLLSALWKKKKMPKYKKMLFRFFIWSQLKKTQKQSYHSNRKA